MFSKLCAVVTSFETTYACTGSCVCSATVSANTLVSLEPTTLKLGGAGAAPPPPLPEGAFGLLPALPPPKALRPLAVAAILPAMPKPALIELIATQG